MTESSELAKITATLSGPTRPIGKTDVDDILPMTEQGVIITKFQRCGKRNCRCAHGQLHGPYQWRVIWDKETQTSTWIYLGPVTTTNDEDRI